MGLLSIFDRVNVDTFFHDDRGIKIFYPFGIMGSGYVLPADREATARRAMRHIMLASYALGFFGAFLAVVFLALPVALTPTVWLLAVGAVGLFALGLSATVYAQKRAVSGLDYAPRARPSLGAWMRHARDVRPLYSHWITLALGLWLLWDFVPPALAAIESRNVQDVATDTVIVVLALFVAWQGLLGIIERQRTVSPQ